MAELPNCVICTNTIRYGEAIRPRVSGFAHLACEAVCRCGHGYDIHVFGMLCDATLDDGDLCECDAFNGRPV